MKRIKTQTYNNCLDLFLESLFTEEEKGSEKQQHLKMWHGGRIDSKSDLFNQFSQSGGRYEYGPGMYLTTHFDTAAKYAKGSRKIYLIELSPSGTNIDDVVIPMSEAEAAIKMFASPKAKQKEVLSHLHKRYSDKPQIPLSKVVTFLINFEAIRPNKTGAFREWIVSQGADYSLVDNPFGWGETMAVVYNTGIITSVKQVKPGEPGYGIDF